MSERERTSRGPDDPGGDLEYELADLGPLMARQEQLASIPPDERFAATLRARLVGNPPTAVPVPPHRRHARLLAPWAGVVAVLAAAVLIVVLHLRSTPAPTPPISAPFVPPTPGASDLSKSYPILGGLGGGGAVNPFVTRIESLHGQVYPGHLTLSAGSLPSSPARLPAYKLLPPAPGSRLRSLARTLAIHGAVRSGRDYIDFRANPRLVTYLAIVQGAGSRTSPQRSVAISAFDGRLIFHDTTDDRGVPSRTPPPRMLAVSKARTWLVALGWPGVTMPLESANVLLPRGMRQISFGWPGVPHADTAAAILWVDHDGQVREALVLPPLARNTLLPAVSVGQAWAQVRAALVPIGVNINPRDPTLPGSGRLQAVSVEQVLTTTNTGAQYLAPAYRFEGVVRIEHTPGTHGWIALVPAVHAR